MSKGFSLLEIVAVIALLALIAAIALPRLTKRRVPLSQQVMKELNHLTRTAHMSALMTGKVHRIHFDIKNQVVQIEKESDKLDSQGNAPFIPLKIPYVKTSAPFSNKLDMEQFLVKGKNMIKPGAGIELTGAWFFLVPDGMAQEVTIRFKEKDTSKMFSLVINPFTATFSNA